MPCQSWHHQQRQEGKHTKGANATATPPAFGVSTTARTIATWRATVVATRVAASGVAAAGLSAVGWAAAGLTGGDLAATGLAAAVHAMQENPDQELSIHD